MGDRLVAGRKGTRTIVARLEGQEREGSEKGFQDRGATVLAHRERGKYNNARFDQPEGRRVLDGGERGDTVFGFVE